MSEQDSLRLVAEVVDRFSTPLRNLRASLQGMSREGMAHSKALNDSFGKVESSARSATQAVATGLTPALSAVGVTGLTVAGSMAAVGAAVRSFSRDVSELGRLSRDVDMSTQSLREFQSVAGKFGIAPEAAQGAVRTFSNAMRDIRRGYGDAATFLHTKGPLTAQLGLKLRGTKNNEEALRIVEETLNDIPNAVDRRKLAEALLGNPDFGRFGEAGREKLRQFREEAQKDLGGLTKEAQEQADRLEHAMKRVGDSLIGIRDAVMGEVASPLATALEKVNTALSDPKTRDEGVKAFKTAMTDVKASLEGMDVKDVKNGALFILEQIGAAARDTATGIAAVGKAVRALQLLKDGEFTEGFKKLGELDASTDLGVGQRKNQGSSKKPSALDEALDAQMRGQSSGSSAEGQRREQNKLTDELRRLREALPDKKPGGEATVQQQSFDASNPLAGLIHTAGYGGVGGSMARVGNALAAQRRQGIYLPNDPTRPWMGRDGGVQLYGGPGEGRGRFPEHMRDQMRESFRSYLMRKVPGYDGGSMVPNLVPGGPGDRVGRALRGERSAEPAGPRPGANPSDYKAVLDHIAESEGTAHRVGGGYNTSLGYGRYLPGGKEQNLTEKTLNEVSALGHHMRRQPGNPNSSALGRYQIVGDTMRGLMKRMGLKGDELFDEKMQDRMAAELARDRGANPRGLQQEWASLVGKRNQRAVELMSQVPRSASTIPRDRPSRETADGEGFAARHRAMQAMGDDRSELFKLPSSSAMQKALRSGAMGSTPRVDANGKVQIHIDKAGPDARVSTSTSGNLFRDVEMSGGRTMARASQEN